MALTNRYSCLARRDFLHTENRFQIHYMEKGHVETPVKCRSQSNGRIKSYGPYEPLLLPGATRVPPHRVSIPNPPYRKRASRNSCKIWIAIQRSDQKLWPLQTGTLAWRYQTSSTPRIDSTSTIWRRASENSCKI